MTHTPPSEAAASSQHHNEPWSEATPERLDQAARALTYNGSQQEGAAKHLLFVAGHRIESLLRMRAKTIEERDNYARLAHDREAWRHRANTLADDLNRIRALVPTASDEQSTLDAVQGELHQLRQEVEKLRHAAREENRLHGHLSNINSALAEAGRPHRHKGDELERIRDLAGERDVLDRDLQFANCLLQRLAGILNCTFSAAPTLEKQAEALVAAAKNGAPPVVGDCLMLAHKPGEWSSSADEFFVYRRVSNTPWVTVHWRHGPGVNNNRPENIEKADGFPSELRHACMAFDTFLRRCGIDVTKLEGLMPVPWVIEAAKLLKDAWPCTADPLGTDEARTAVAAVRDLGPELAKAGIQVGPRCSHAEAVAQLRGERDRWRQKFEDAEDERKKLDRFITAVGERLSKAGFSIAPGISWAFERSLAELDRLRRESKRDLAAKQQALLDEIARLFPGKGPLIERVHKVAALAKIGADLNNGKPTPSPWRERFMRLRDSIKVQLAWCGHSDGVPYDGMHKEHAVLSCALRNADALLEEAAGESVSWVGGLSLFERRSCQEPKAEPLPFTGSDLLPSDATKRKRIVEELRQVVNRNSIEHACGDTPDFILAEAMLDAAFAFGRFTRSRDAHLGGRSFSNPGQPIDPSDPIGPKFAPATGQPRTEVPVGPDCSGALVGLGEAFRRNLANAVDCLPSDGHPIDATTVKIAIRNLHAAVAELARGVERIGGAK